MLASERLSVGNVSERNGTNMARIRVVKRNVSLEALRGWNQLEPEEQQRVQSENRLLFEEVEKLGEGKLAIGHHLYNLREILGAKNHRGLWERYLKTTPFSRATANRYIQNYEVTRTILPQPILQVAMLRGMDTISAKTVEAFPPPRTLNPLKINNYLDSLHSRPVLVEKKVDVDGLQKSAFNSVRLAYEKVPNRQKEEFLERHIGYVMDLGEMAPRKFGPETVPADYVVPRGRPVKKEAA